jgi:hypothetical protein
MALPLLTILWWLAAGVEAPAMGLAAVVVDSELERVYL